MDSENIKTNDSNRYAAPLGDIVKMQLNSVKNTKNSLARIMRAYMSGTIDHAAFRNMIYAFSTLTNIHKLEKDIEIEKRLKDLESKLNDNSKIG